MPQEIEEMLWWLPEDTETVIVSHRPFMSRLHESETPLETRFLELPTLLAAEIQDRSLADTIQRLKVLWAVEGGRRFEPPPTHGLGPFEGCEVLRFAPGSERTLRGAVEVIAPRSAEQILYGGKLVYVFRERWESFDWTLYLSIPEPVLLVVATHSGYIQDVLTRMQQRARQRAIPDSLPEWRHVDTAARAWAIRHYRRDPNPEDLTSPFVDSRRRGSTDPHAVGFAFSLHQDGVATLRYLSGAADPVRAVKGKHLAFAAFEEADVELIAPGVVGCTVKVSAEPDSGTFDLQLMCSLGHPVAP